MHSASESEKLVQKFLHNESLLRLLFAYLNDPKDVVHASQVNKKWHAVINGDEVLWNRLGHHYGFAECKYPEQTWKEFLKEMFCPVAQLDKFLTVECCTCFRRSKHLDRTQAELLNKVCRSEIIKEDPKTNACVHCGHHSDEHLTHLRYREAQIERAIKAHEEGNYEKKALLISTVVRIAGGRLRSAERNLLRSSFSMLMRSLQTEIKLNHSENKRLLSIVKLIKTAEHLSRLLEDHVIPYCNIDTLAYWLELKVQCCDIIAKYSSDPSAIKEAYITSTKIKAVYASSSALQVGVNYCTYCVSHGNLMRAYRVARNANITQVLGQMEQSREIYRLKCDKVFMQGYLRRKDTESMDGISLPLWVVYGIWDYHTCMFIYDHIESNEAKEIILIARNSTVFAESETEPWFSVTTTTPPSTFSALLPTTTPVPNATTTTSSPTPSTSTQPLSSSSGTGSASAAATGLATAPIPIRANVGATYTYEWKVNSIRERNDWCFIVNVTKQ